MNGLVVLAGVAALIVLLVWPRYGLVALGRRLPELTRKERMEEWRIKYLHHCEYSGLNGTLEGMAGVLQIPRNQAADLIYDLEAARLVSTLAGGPL